MRFQLHLYWNGACVLEATTTAAIAYGTIHAHMTENFVTKPPLPTLSQITMLNAGSSMGGDYGDGTGHAAYKLVCQKD